MRIAILLGLMLIADAIKTINYSESATNMIVGIFIVLAMFDIFDFFYKERKKNG
jgi:hypothetical protein